MSATPGACIKPGLVRRPLCHKVNLPSCVARQPLCHKVNLPRCEVNLPSCVARWPLCHKANLPRCEARRRHLIMTCDIFGTGQTNTLTLCYLLGKSYKPANSSATLELLKSTRSTKITGEVIDVSRTHIPLKALAGLVRSLNSYVKAFKTVNSPYEEIYRAQPPS